jgi:hypothetical protein
LSSDISFNPSPRPPSLKQIREGGGIQSCLRVSMIIRLQSEYFKIPKYVELQSPSLIV